MRYRDWEQQLANYFIAMRDVPFEYGVNDCCLFAASAVAAMTGVDVAEQYRGKYTTELGAAKALKKLGGGTVEATFDALFPAIGAAFAQRGDLVFNGEAIGVCIGDVAYFVGQEADHIGLVTIPRNEWSKGWSVG